MTWYHATLYGYWICLALTLAWALARGGPPERIAVAALVAGSLLTYLLPYGAGGRYAHVEWSRLVIDVGVFAVLLWLSIRTDHKWTLAAAGIQLMGVVGHFPKLLAPVVSRFTYNFMNGLWSYGIMAAIIVGVIAHDRRTKRAGIEPSSPI